MNPVLRTFLSLSLPITMSGCYSPQPADTSTHLNNKFGQTFGQVVNGSSASTAHLRSTVALVDSNGDAFCAGTLIASQLVLTAAHCVEGITPTEFSVGVGVLNGRAIPQVNQVSVGAIYIHEHYLKAPPSKDPTSLGRDNDLAIVHLEADVTTILPTPILPESRVNQTLTNGAHLIVSGYGINNLKTWDGGELHVGAVPFERMNEHEMILGEKGNKTDTCNGDSGGPAYLEANNQRFLVGVTSRAVENGQLLCGDGGIYTLAPAYLAWIKQTANHLYSTDITPPVAGPPVHGTGTMTNQSAQSESQTATSPNANTETGVSPAPKSPNAKPSEDCTETDKEDGKCRPANSQTAIEKALASQNTKGTAGFGEPIILDAKLSSSNKRIKSSSGCVMASGSPAGAAHGFLLLATAALLMLSRKRPLRRRA